MNLVFGIGNLLLLVLGLAMVTEIPGDLVKRHIPEYARTPARPAPKTAANKSKHTSAKPAAPAAPAPAEVARWLPAGGIYRFARPNGLEPEADLPQGPRGGFIDRFGNEWLPNLDDKGRVASWRLFLSADGRRRLGRLVGETVYVTADGRRWSWRPDFHDLF